MIIGEETKNLQLEVQRRIRMIEYMEQKGKDLPNGQGYLSGSVPLRDNMLDAYEIMSVIMKMNRE